MEKQTKQAIKPLSSILILSSSIITFFHLYATDIELVCFSWITKTKLKKIIKRKFRQLMRPNLI